MVVRSDPAQLVLQKFADEGSSSPFMARLLLGIMNLRDTVFPEPVERTKFDKAYEVFNTLVSIRSANNDIVAMWKDHVEKVTTSKIVRMRGATIEIEESIDKDLRKQIESFLNGGVRALKGMQKFLGLLKVDIGFLFQKPAAFAKGLAKLEKTDPLLAEYLGQTRTWSERLIKARNDVEHDGWVLPRIAYSKTESNGMQAVEPQISGQTVSEFVTTMLDRLMCFVEEVTVHCLQKQLPPGVNITEIPLAERANAETAVRFRLTTAQGGSPAWTIVYHEEGFEQT
jgi:hypothetical protein